jgi:3',5'-cyclic AMP phosphodiesterase CpdA
VSIALLVLLLLGGSAWGSDVPHLVLLGDPHLPGRHLPAKERVRETVNGWPEVTGVVALGDLCEDLGTAEEYAAVGEFFRGFRAPVHPLVGNHDYIYGDARDDRGRRLLGSPSSRGAKLERFKTLWGLPEPFHSRRMGAYRLLFLATDHSRSGNLAEMSERQMAWLDELLAADPHAPTILFFHAPLAGTLTNFNQRANSPGFVAQPERELRDLLRRHGQVLLWASGHMHVTPANESYAAPINRYEGRVLNVHTPDMNRAAIWTNSLWLHPDRVEVRTFDHGRSAWLPRFDRRVEIPRR